MEITKIKIGSNIYDIKDNSALTAQNVTEAVNLALYGSTTKPNGATIVTSENIATIAQDAGIGGGSDGDTKNTTGTTNQSGVKMFLVGGLELSTNPVTYSNSSCYIGSDNCLYTNGSKTTNSIDVTNAIYTELYGSTTKPTGVSVITTLNLATAAQDAGITGGTGADTKNTAGATNNASTKLFLVGSTELTANPQTYTNVNCYIGTDNSLYTNGVKTVNATDVNKAIYTELYGLNTKPSGAYTVTSQNISSAISNSGINIGSYYQLDYPVSRITGSGSLTIPGTDPVYFVSVSANISSVKLTTNPPYGHSCHVIFKSSNSTKRTVSIANHSTNRICPNGSDISLTVPASGYVEVDFLNLGNDTIGNEVYVRGV